MYRFFLLLRLAHINEKLWWTMFSVGRWMGYQRFRILFLVKLKKVPARLPFPGQLFSNWELLCSTSNHYLHLESAFFSNDEFFQFSRLLKKASLLFLRPYVRSFACFCSFTAWGNLFIDTTMSFLDDVGNFSYGPGKLCDLYKKCIVDLKFRLLC